MEREGRIEELNELLDAFESADPAKIVATADRLAKAPAPKDEPEEDPLEALYRAPASTTHPKAEDVPLKVMRVASKPKERSDLSGTIARFQARAEAERAIRRQREAHEAKQDRLREFARYEAAGQPNGPLTPEQKRELAELKRYDADAARAKIRDAEAAYRADDHEAVHRILRR